MKTIPNEFGTEFDADYVLHLLDTNNLGESPRLLRHATETARQLRRALELLTEAGHVTLDQVSNALTMAGRLK